MDAPLPQKSNALKNIFLVTLLILTITAVTYGAITVNDNIKRLKATKVTFKGIKALGTDTQKQQIGFQVTLNVINGSDIDIHVNGYKLDIYLNSIFVAPVVSKESRVIKANATSPISFNVYFNPFSLGQQNVSISTLLTGLANFTNMIIKIDGYISAGLLGINIDNFPVQLEQTLGSLIGA